MLFKLSPLSQIVIYCMVGALRVILKVYATQKYNQRKKTTKDVPVVSFLSMESPDVFCLSVSVASGVNAWADSPPVVYMTEKK